MASNERSLLMAIAADPEEDTPRLVYADWLDENASSDNSHSARAEFIRTQISIARGIDVATGMPLTEELAAEFAVRANELCSSYQCEWESEIRHALGQSFQEVTLHRGFPRDVWVNGVQELIASGILKSNANTLTGLTVRNLGNQLPNLLSYPGIVRLTTLNLEDNGIGPIGAEAIATSPCLTNLTTLHLGFNHIGIVGLSAIAASPCLTNLTVLNLEDNAIGTIGADGNTGADVITASPFLTKLTTLHLPYNHIGITGLSAIVVSPHLANLTTLNLEANDIGIEGAEAIAASPYLAKLATLNLGFNEIRNAGAVAIAASPNLVNLTMLELEDNGIGTEGAVSLSTSQHLANLTTLNLWNNNIGDAGALAITSSPHLSLSAKVFALQSTGFNALADQVQRNSEGRYDARQ